MSGAGVNKSKTGEKATPKQCRERFPNPKLHVAGNGLFSSTCNLVVDHERKSSIQNHLQTAKHTGMDNKRKYEERALAVGPQPLSE